MTAEDHSGMIDLGQCLSLVNRRFYRQGMEYYVDSWSISSESSCDVLLVTLSQNWICSNAWVAAFRTWLRSQEQVDNFDEIKGRYHDYKIFMEEVHAQAGMSANLLPRGYDPALVAAKSATAGASWDASEIQIPNVGGVVGNTVGYEMHMVGASSGSKGIIEGYAKSRARPQITDPNLVEGGSEVGYWMDLAFDTGDNLSEITTDLKFENDSPPYFVDENTEFEFYAGGSNASDGAGIGVDYSNQLALNPAVGSYATRHGTGLVVPCGLIALAGSGTGNFVVTFNLSLGPYKGVMARPMQDVN